jgi:hypothetical protein
VAADTVVIAAWNEEGEIVPTLERIARLSYRGPIEVVLADTTRPIGQRRSRSRQPDDWG